RVPLVDPDLEPRDRPFRPGLEPDLVDAAEDEPGDPQRRPDLERADARDLDADAPPGAPVPAADEQHGDEPRRHHGERPRAGASAPTRASLTVAPLSRCAGGEPAGFARSLTPSKGTSTGCA